jgi:hypothetical protein
VIYVAMPCGCGTIPASMSRSIRNGFAPSMQFMNPLAALAEGDVIDLLGIAIPAAAFPKHLKHSRRPMVTLVGDDPGTPEGMGGPDAWACAHRLSKWARAVIIHGAGGEREHYAAACQAALKVGRVAMIETTSMHAKAWAERLRCPHTLLILPKGGSHPVMAEAEQ